MEQEEANKQIVSNHTYPVQVIFMSINFIIHALTGFRCAQRVFEVFQQSCSLVYSFFNFTPSWQTIKFWVLRIGLYKLTRDKEKASDWVFIVDFKVQAGRHKCLLILGARLKNIIKDSSGDNMTITHEDFEPLSIIPVEKSTGEDVFKALEEISKKTGPARQIVADHGGDVKKGIELYCKSHEGTANTYDIVHKLAILLGKELAQDPVWKKILSAINDTKQKTKQSSEAFLLPPRQREKARWMNVDVQIDWLNEMIMLLNFQNKEDFAYLDVDNIERKIGWILDHEESIEEYIEILAIIREARHLVRNEGLHRASCHDFFSKLDNKMIKFGKRASNFGDKIFDFLKEEGSQAREGEVLLGSSEGIESVIGKYKYIIEERTRSTKSITKCILTIGAIVGKNTIDVVKEALETVSVKQVDEWCEKFINKTDLAKRREIMNKCREAGPKALRSFASV